MTKQRATYQAGPDRPSYLNRVHIGNALELAADLPAESIHCIVTSPPYYGLRDYGLPPFDWQAVEYAPMPGLSPVRVEAWRGCLGLEPDPFMYVGHLVAIFRALRRALRSDGTAWVNLGDSYAGNNSSNGEGEERSLKTEKFHGGKAHLEQRRVIAETGLKPKNLIAIPWRAALALQADGWWLRSDVIWHKPDTMPESVTDRPTKAHEYLFLLSKSKRYFYDAEAVREANQIDPSSGWAKQIARGQNVGIYDYQKPSQKLVNRFDKDFDNEKGVEYRTNGRNRRSVWQVATAQFKQAHFATYPPALIEPCILASTSERGCCPTCGAGWVRVVEREFVGEYNNKEAQQQQVRANTMSGGIDKVTLGRTEHIKMTTTGFRPACDCPTADPVPCVVLDPFIGSGTTAQVAIEHRRHWIGFEANPDYAGELVSERLNGTQVRLI